MIRPAALIKPFFLLDSNRPEITYEELVKLNKSLIDNCSELIRLFVMRN